LGHFPPPKKIAFGEFFILFWFPLCQFGFDGVFGGKHADSKNANGIIRTDGFSQFLLLIVFYLGTLKQQIYLYENGVKLTNKEMKPYENRIICFSLLPKWDVTIEPLGG